MKKFRDIIILVIKGFVMGIANLIPGVSGGTLALILGIYERFIGAISHLFSKFKENMMFLLPIILGMGLAIVSLSKAMDYCLSNYLFATIMFFLGAILGGLPMLSKKLAGTKIHIGDIIAFIIPFVVVLGMLAIAGDNVVEFTKINAGLIIKLVLVGALASATMIIPGVSGSAMLMTIGYYKPVIGVLKDITNIDNLGQNILILLPFGVGIVVGLLIIAKIIEYCLKNYEIKSYWAIIGFVISSAVAIVIQNFFMGGLISFGIVEGIVGIILCVAGFFTAYKLGEE